MRMRVFACECVVLFMAVSDTAGLAVMSKLLFA